MYYISRLQRMLEVVSAVRGEKCLGNSIARDIRNARGGAIVNRCTEWA